MGWNAIAAFNVVMNHFNCCAVFTDEVAMVMMITGEWNLLIVSSIL